MALDEEENEAEAPAEEESETPEVDTEPLQDYVDGLSKEERYALKEIVNAACADEEETKKFTIADILGTEK